MPYVPSTQPETTGQLLRRSLKLYRLTFLKVLFLAFLVSIVTFIPRIIALFTGHYMFAGLPPLSPYKLLGVLIYIVALIFMTAMLWRLQCVTTNTKESLKEDLKMGIKKIPFILAAAIVEALIFRLLTLTTFGFHLLINQQPLAVRTNYLDLLYVFLPILFELYLSIYIFILFIFYFPLILTENKGPIIALFRSARLVWRNWWQTVWVQSIPWLCYLIVMIILQKLGVATHIYVLYLPKTISASATIIHIITFALFVPWFTATMLIQLRDLELRKQIKQKNAALTSI